MLFGHNTNVKVGETTFHIQTEDRGIAHALIDSTVYFRGRVLHRRTNNYFDLLPLSPDREQTLKARMDEQHRTIVEAIRTGELALSLPAEEAAPAPTAAPSARAPSAVSPAASLKLELMNPRTTESSTVTVASGDAQFEFEMPRLTSAESALVIEAMRGNVKGQLRFQLRSKPRVPSAS